MKDLLFENGDILPNIGLGTFLSKKNEVYEAVVTAIKTGYRHIDCAYIYGNEAEIGRAIHYAIINNWVKRDDLFITSKLWNSYHAPDQVEKAIKKSLADLQLDYLDLYLIHWPIAFKTGCDQAKNADDLVCLEEMPISSTWEVMEELKMRGLTRHIGVSNFNIPKLNDLLINCMIKPEVNQIEIHPYFQQSELIDFCKQHKILITAYSPLGSRHLINSEDGPAMDHLISKMAHIHSCSATQILLAWGMERDVAVIPKSVNPDRIKNNYEALNVKLDASDIIEMSILDKNQRVAKGLYCVFPDGCYSYESIWEE